MVRLFVLKDMPFSIDAKFYFVRVPKTAGMFLLDRLEAAVPDLVSARQNGFPPVKIGGINHGDHIRLSDLYREIERDPDKFTRFGLDLRRFLALRKFAVVRNPYLRTLSLLSFYHRFNGEEYTPGMFERDLERIRDKGGDYHMEQSAFVCNGRRDELLVDRLFYVEEDFVSGIGKYIGAELGGGDDRENVTQTRKIEDEAYFESDRVREIIEELFARDFRVLGYRDGWYPRN